MINALRKSISNAKLLEKFYKIFQLEGSQGYENRAVMGGMRALAKTGNPKPEKTLFQRL